MEQKLPIGLGEGEIAQFIKDQEIEAAQQIRGAPLSIGAGFGIKLVHQVHDIED